jgi:hypothetical protein
LFFVELFALERALDDVLDGFNDEVGPFVASEAVEQCVNRAAGEHRLQVENVRVAIEAHGTGRRGKRRGDSRNA